MPWEGTKPYGSQYGSRAFQRPGRFTGRPSCLTMLVGHAVNALGVAFAPRCRTIVMQPRSLQPHHRHA